MLFNAPSIDETVPTNPVVRFELPYQDRERAERFYTMAFGWQTRFLGPDMGDCVLVTTAESDARPGTPAGAIHGGLFPNSPDRPLHDPSLVIAVRDIDQAMRAVRHGGGKILGDPYQIADYGRYVAFADTEGNRLTMLEPIPR